MNFSFGGQKHRAHRNRRNAASRKPRSSRRDLQLETLEDRSLLAVNPLVISEINYHPTVPYSGAFDKDQYEFVELYNAGGTPLQLAGVNFQARTGATTNITVTIGSRILQPGDYALLVRNSAAMQERYGAGITSKIAASWPAASTLANSGNTIRLQTPVGINENTIIQFTYDDGSDTGEVFPNRADGNGATLELFEPNDNVDQAYYAAAVNWNSSEEYLGSPGRASALEVNPRIVVNEILANSNDLGGEVDKIELGNISNNPVDLSGWMITDNTDNPVGSSEYLAAYVIPNGTVLQPGQYHVLTQSQFSPVGGNNSFALSSAGERLYLISREADGTRHFEDIIDYDATRTSQSIGRTPNLTGSFLPMTTQTFGAANSAQEPSPLVITEVMYKRWTPNPDLNFIELYNRTNAAINVGANTGWNVAGVSYTFPNGSSIAANTAVVLVGFNLADTTKLTTFRNTYSIPVTVPIFSWFKTTDPGNLSDNGERLALYEPFVDGTIPVPKVLVDSVDFDDDSPWPEGPGGGVAGVSYSLTRTSATNVGDYAHSWRAALPTPGSFTPPAITSPLDGLVISEIMYNPAPLTYENNGDPLPANHLEYVEVYNPTAGALNLSNAGLGQGVEFRFLTGTTIAAGERILVVPFNPAVPSASRDEFLSTYGLEFGGPVRMFGPWTQPGSLSNGGEGLALVDGLGNTIFEVEYNNRGGWPERAAGLGSSLELIDPSAVPLGAANNGPYLNDPTKWRASTEFRGSPGTAGVGAVAPTIVINEVQSHTDPLFTDAIEVFNVSAQPINLDGWFLSDDPTKNPISEWFILPPITLQPGEYITFDACLSDPCNNFSNLPFNLDAAEGEDLFLIGATPEGKAFFADQVYSPPTFNNVSLGRWPNGTGPLFPMASRTISQYNTNPTPGNVYSDGANSGPVNSEVVISEVMYNPGGANPNDFEYIEIQNTLGVPLPLGPVESGAGWTTPPTGWRIDGIVDFEFTSAHTIPALGTMILVSFDPADTAKANAFRQRYGLSAGTPLYGPFEEYKLIPDDGGEITLNRPDSGPAVLPVEERFTPQVLADRVTFDDVAPWPTAANGTGQSLTRSGPTAFGNFSTSWSAAAPSPGSVSTPPAGAPKVTAVTLNGSTWAPAFVTAVSAGNPTPGFTVPKGTQQSGVIPWEKINQVSITFDKAVTIASGALAIRGVNTANYTVSATPTNPSGFTYTWTVTTPIVGDRLLIELDDAKVTSSGSSLDGEWTDNTSTGNSGNGTAGGDFKFRVNVLPGDVDGDGDTQNDDRMDVRLAMFTSTSVGGSTYSTRRDLDGSGKINVVDFIIARNHLNKTLPAGTPNSPAAPDSVVVRANRPDRRATATTARAVTRAAVDQALSADILSGSDTTGSDVSESSSTLRARRAGRAVVR